MRQKQNENRRCSPRVIHKHKISDKYENTNKTRSNNLTSGGTTSDLVVKSIIKLCNIIRRV